MSDKEILLFSLLGFIAVLLCILIFLLLKNKNTKTSDSSKLIQDQIFNLSKVFDEKLSQNNTIINNNLNQNLKTNSDISKTSNKLIEDITIKLASLEETNKQIKDI
jgi:hypothetical protein